MHLPRIVRPPADVDTGSTATAAPPSSPAPAGERAAATRALVVVEHRGILQYLRDVIGQLGGADALHAQSDHQSRAAGTLVAEDVRAEVRAARRSEIERRAVYGLQRVATDAVRRARERLDRRHPATCFVDAPRELVVRIAEQRGQYRE